MIRVLMLIAAMGMTCCDRQTGPPNVSEKSVVRPGLSDRVTFVETYVRFRRQYVQLEYDIVFQNNSGGMVAGPSDWDVRLVAQVPVGELDDWIDQGMTASSAPTQAWHVDTTKEIDTANVVEWYADSGRSVGIDRVKGIVAYRNHTMGQ